MVFVGIYRAIYDYTPQTAGELAIAEGDLVFVIEKSTDDDWWKAKKRAPNDQEEEPEGLIPYNYVEEVAVQGRAKALYDYARQTDEELSFQEDAILDVYDSSEDDWTLVGLDGEFGFVPANYIETEDASEVPPPTRSRTGAQDYPSPAASPVSPSPAAALAGIIQQKTGTSDRAVSSRQPTAQFTPEASDEDAPPPMPQRPVSQQEAPVPPQTVSPPAQYAAPQSPEPPGVMASPGAAERGGYHLYNIHEMISHLGRNKKMPTTLGINLAKGTILIAPERSRDGPQKEWTAEKLAHYSIEGKHVFMELVKPSKSIDFHAGAKDTAQEIVASLGEMAGAARAGGLREVISASAGSGQKKGRMLYEFMAQGEDEVTVAVDDEVIVLDDRQSEEWWMVRRLKNGNEGVVPSSYVEIIGVVAPESVPAAPISAPTNAEPPRSKSSRAARKEQARLEEERLAREAMSTGSRGQEVPDRHSSLNQRDNDGKSAQKTKRGSRSDKSANSSKSSPPDWLTITNIFPEPDPSRVRSWTDRTGTFKVEAQFLGLKDSKINLHKVNGVKIAVAVNKMSLEDIEYVERETGRSLDEEKPLSEIRRRGTQKQEEKHTRSPVPTSGAAVQPTNPVYDWFDFFLSCGVNPQICERYASAFNRDQMGEENMQDVDPTLLRTLGLKEGDILRVMKTLDAKFGRARNAGASADADTNGDNGLFSGPGGTLRNNTRKGRPAPAIQNSDTVDPRAFEQAELKAEQPSAPSPGAPKAAPEPQKKLITSFDDDAWDVKPATQAQPPRTLSPPVQAPAQAPIQRPAPTGAMSDLSLLSPPLQPTLASQPQKAQPTGADPLLFEQLSQPAAPRQRPQPTQLPYQSSLIPPPPQRPTSAPQNPQQSGFAPPPLRPQITGNQPQLAPPGQSLGELNQQRMIQQMYPQQTGFQYPQQTGFQQPMNYQPTGFSTQQQLMNGQANGSPFADPPRAPYQPVQMQQTGFQQMQPQQTGINSFLPPALQPQRTGFLQSNGFPQNQQTGFQQQQQYPPNNFQQQQQANGQSGFNQPYSQQPLQQQQTGYGLQPQQNGFALQSQQTGYGQTAFSQQQAPPVPPMPRQQQTPAPLQPQKTGPAPPIRFGVTGPAANKLTAQPTGRRANLSAATPQNPFGF